MTTTIEFTTRNLAPEGADPVEVPAPLWAGRDMAHLAHHRQQKLTAGGPCSPESCLCAERTAALAARADAIVSSTAWVQARQVPVTVDAPTMTPTVQDLEAAWSPHGLRLTLTIGGRRQQVRVDERGQQALRDALGTR